MRLSLIFEYEADRIKAETNIDFWNENNINKKIVLILFLNTIIKQTTYDLSISKHLQKQTNELTRTVVKW